MQTAANRALRLGLIEYDRRHGYRGPLAKVEVPGSLDPARLEALLAKHDPVGVLQPAVVVSVGDTAARVYVRGQGAAQIGWDGLAWARRVVNGRPGGNPRKAGDVLARGDVVYVVADRAGNALLAQVPEAQSALVALDPDDGAVVSLVGGFDYYSNQFNRVTQARRQPGSGFKPFLYSAALENGMTPASIILDTPIVMDDTGVEGGWRPENHGGEYGGPTRLREALVKSLNLVSIRILREMGMATAIDYATRFGFEKAILPDNLTLALGTLPATPLQMATGYATFANGGYKVVPYLIDRIENSAGKVLFQAAPLVVCRSCDNASTPGAPAGVEAPVAELLAPTEGVAAPLVLPPLAPTPTPEQVATRNADAPTALRALAAEQGGRGYLKPERVAPRVISAQNAWLMTDILGDVIQRGTGVRARSLGRHDLSGKTGTTNDSRDAWFNGFNGALVGTVWVGFDEERSLGDSEEGSRTAVPIWVYFMREALRNVPEKSRPVPPGLVSLPISPRTGAVVQAGDPEAINEYFLIDRLPQGVSIGPLGSPPTPTVPQGTAEGLF